MMMRFAALAVLAFAMPAQAMEIPAEARLLPGWRMADGRHVAAIRIALDPGWKTYWRAPGDAGIPPTFDWDAPNLSSAAVHWPVPEVFEQDGLRSIGYSGEVVLPLILTPADRSEPITGRLVLGLGVCEVVCVPVEVAFAVDLPAGAGVEDPVIASALADRPRTADEAGVGATRCRIDPTPNGLRLSAAISVPPLGPDEAVAVETADPSVWVSEARVERDGDTLTATVDLVPSGSAPVLVDRSRLRFTILAAGAAAEVRGCD